MRSLHFILLTILLFIFFPAFSQQELTKPKALSYSSKLYEYSLLNKKGKDELERLIIEAGHNGMMDEVSRAAILAYLAEVYYGEFWYRGIKKPKIEKKIKPEDHYVDRSFSSMDFPLFSSYTAMVPTNRSTYGFTRTRTLEELKEIGLVDDRVYHEAKAKLQDESLTTEFELLLFLAERTQFYEQYHHNKQEQLEYSNRLADAGILTRAGVEKLEASYKEWELKEMHEILALSPRATIVDLSQYDADPQQIYRHMFKAIQQLVPTFEYSDLSINVEEEQESEELATQYVMISFIANGREYHHRFFQDTRRIKGKALPYPIEPIKISIEFHKGVNKYLTDIESEYRLYTINIPERNEMSMGGYSADDYNLASIYGQDKIGLILLKEGEAELVSDDPYLLSDESYETRFTKNNIQTVLSDLSSIGLFEHLTEEELTVAKECLNSKLVSSFSELLACYPKTLVIFDWESGNLENPYEELTRELGRASRGDFTPIQIQDGFNKGFSSKRKKIPYSFEFNGKKYEAILDFEGDWLDYKFFEMIQQALKENNVVGEFYHTYSDGQVSGYLFLTPDQHNYLMQKYPDVLKEEGELEEE
ncbi:hypothetical protein D770_05375 [Flammeovirgaceae bacterium 311]|nr:hypothetical protein D770_05375 [Flammeovirgaceae bacterium 311]